VAPPFQQLSEEPALFARLRIWENLPNRAPLLPTAMSVLVSREELHHRLWPSDTFLGFDEGLNTAVRKLRHVLDDSADAPRYIETIPKRGYRFIATVDFAPEGDWWNDVRESDLREHSRGSRRKLAALVGSFAILVTALLAGGVLLRTRKGSPSFSSIVVLPLEQLSGDAAQEYFRRRHD
jgi:hypothetical protein